MGYNTDMIIVCGSEEKAMNLYKRFKRMFSAFPMVCNDFGNSVVTVTKDGQSRMKFVSEMTTASTGLTGTKATIVYYDEFCTKLDEYEASIK